MTNRIKKILFPFFKKYSFLKKYWWHRLFLVLFIITIIVIWLFPWRLAFIENESQIKVCNNIYQAGMTLSDSLLNSSTIPSLSENRGVIWSNFSDCLDRSDSSYSENIGWDLIGGMILALLVSYALQFIYYKVFIYIIFGKDYDHEK